MQDKDPICVLSFSLQQIMHHKRSYAVSTRGEKKNLKSKKNFPGIPILLVSCWLQGKLSCEHNFINAGIQNTAIKFKQPRRTTLTFTNMQD